MVEHSAMSSAAGSQVAPASVTVTPVESDSAVALATGVGESDGKSPITGLEPGTLALIGFGLLALAATRRNVR